MTRFPFVLVLVLAGCTPGPEKTSPAPAPAVPEFNAKSGLLLPQETQRSLGLRVVDVEERSIVASFDLSLRVYESGPDRARASGRVNADQSAMLGPGQPVVAQSTDGAAITGLVVRAEETLKAVSGAGEVLVEFPGAAGRIATGQFLEGVVSTGPRAPTTVVPAAALLECSEGTFVYAVNGDYFVRTPVSAGMSDGDHVEITDGLYEGDQVVAQPVLSLWMTELASVKGGQSCCAVSPEEK
jgi:hypothetical protein